MITQVHFECDRCKTMIETDRRHGSKDFDPARVQLSYGGRKSTMFADLCTACEQSCERWFTQPTAAAK